MKPGDPLSSLGQLDLNLLYVFHVVYRERSVSRAGKILGVSQSAVSHSIARLRTHVGATLFEQKGGGLVPTPIANRMAPGIQAALGRLADSVAGSTEFDPRRDVAHVTLAMPALLEPLLLPEVVGSLRRVAPQVVVRSARLDRAKAKRYLETGAIDAAFDTVNPAQPDLSSECVLEDTLCVVSSQQRSGVVDRDAYLEAEHVGVSSRSSGPTLMDILLLRQGLRRNVVVRCQRYESAARIVASSSLLLTMIRGTAYLVASTMPVTVAPLAIPIPPLKVHLYWHRHRDDDPVLVWLRSLLRTGLVDLARSFTA
ncbi:MAG TPA: LysR family transcriptional regulator [Polyangiaceae bacterium]|nr:LysR family transcriptional regulator [Polyangiaceae bacterium]